MGAGLITGLAGVESPATGTVLRQKRQNGAQHAEFIFGHRMCQVEAVLLGMVRSSKQRITNRNHTSLFLRRWITISNANPPSIMAHVPGSGITSRSPLYR